MEDQEIDANALLAQILCVKAFVEDVKYTDPAALRDPGFQYFRQAVVMGCRAFVRQSAERRDAPERAVWKEMKWLLTSSDLMSLNRDRWVG